jgi:hypothetical protein
MTWWWLSTLARSATLLSGGTVLLLLKSLSAIIKFKKVNHLPVDGYICLVLNRIKYSMVSATLFPRRAAACSCGPNSRD